MSAEERGGGAGGYLRDIKATVYYGGRLCVLVYSCIKILHPFLLTITGFLRQLNAK